MKYIISCFLFFVSSSLKSQDAIQLLQAIQRLDGANSVQEYTSINDQLEKMALLFPKNWLVQYYASLGYAFMSAKGFDPSEQHIEKSILYMQKAKQIEANDEVYCLESFVYSIKMSKSPYTRWLVYKNRILESLETAQRLNPDNPRVYILKASVQKNIPSWLGGGCTSAKKYIQLASEKWVTQSINTIQPHWGAGTLAALKKGCQLF